MFTVQRAFVAKVNEELASGKTPPNLERATGTFMKLKVSVDSIPLHGMLMLMDYQQLRGFESWLATFHGARKP